MKKIRDEIIYCQNRKCPNEDCLRFHRNAPFEIMTRWMSEKPKLKDDNKCKYYLTE